MSTKEFQLQDVLDIQWGDTNTTKASYVPDGYLAYSASGPDGFLEKFDYDREGIVLSAIGANCGSTFFASGKWSCIKNTIRIFPKSESVDLRYFYYMTKSPDFWPIRGSAQPFISQTDIREMYAEFPEIEAQRRVANLLSRIDRLIKKNQKLSSILEEIAETIFKSWFIDFDPVKAKMAGEAPVGMDAETAALFPDSMEESELGEIPSGWSVATIAQLGKVVTGKTPSTKQPSFWGEDIPFVTIPDMHNTSVISSTARYLSTEGARSQKSQSLPAGSTLVSCIASPGLVSFTFDPCHTNQQINSVIPSDRVEPAWLYFNLKALVPRIIQRSAVGTMFANLNKSSFSSIASVLPPHSVIAAFEKFGFEILNLMRVLQNQSGALSAIRDALMPRLISGELEIPDEMLAA